MNKKMLSSLVMILVAASLLGGCRSRSKPTPTPTPAPPTAEPTTTAIPIPQGWTEHRSGNLTIQLPAEWAVIDAGAGDLEAIFAEFEDANPDLAQIIGGAESLEGIDFWAFAPAGGDFVDNLNIRHSSLEGQTVDSLQEGVDEIVGQYNQLGIAVDETDADLQIGGRHAARIVYSFPLNASEAAPGKVIGYQYLVLTDSDLWILSYATGPDTAVEAVPVFEQSARTFVVE